MTKLGDNKGHRYEDMIFDILERAGVLYPGTTRKGKSGGVDAVFCHLGKPHRLEVKNGLSADYGQKMFSWSRTGGWTWSEEDDVTDFFTLFGALKHVRKKGVVPVRYSKDRREISYDDARKDQEAFEDRSFVVRPDALWRFYGSKGVHYIQVGSGYGFYHLDEDVAGLGTEQFNCEFILRFRAKYHDRNKRERDAEGKVLRITPTPWNYSFFAVLKVKGKPKRSRYNIERSQGQEFPPMKP